MERKRHIFLLINASLLLPFFFMTSCGGGGVDGSNSRNNTVIPANSVLLTWEAPTTRIDGTPLNDLAGFYVYFGQVSRDYTSRVDVGNELTYRMDKLQPGLYFFAVTAYDASGNQSSFSNEVSKTIH